MSKEVLKIALEALEPLEFVGKRMDGGNPKIDEAITAIKEALAQSEQECNCSQGQLCRVCDPDVANGFEQPKQKPVAWLSKSGKGLWFHEPNANLNATPLYTTPPQRTWVGLTDEDKSLFSSWLDHKTDAEVFEAIEAKLKEKNT